MDVSWRLTVSGTKHGESESYVSAEQSTKHHRSIDMREPHQRIKILHHKPDVCLRVSRGYIRVFDSTSNDLPLSVKVCANLGYAQSCKIYRSSVLWAELAGTSVATHKWRAVRTVYKGWAMWSLGEVRKSLLDPLCPLELWDWYLNTAMSTTHEPTVRKHPRPQLMSCGGTKTQEEEKQWSRRLMNEPCERLHWRFGWTLQCSALSAQVRHVFEKLQQMGNGLFRNHTIHRIWRSACFSPQIELQRWHVHVFVLHTKTN